MSQKKERINLFQFRNIYDDHHRCEGYVSFIDEKVVLINLEFNDTSTYFFDTLIVLKWGKREEKLNLEDYTIEDNGNINKNTASLLIDFSEQWNYRPEFKILESFLNFNALNYSDKEHYKAEFPKQIMHLVEILNLLFYGNSYYDNPWKVMYQILQHDLNSYAITQTELFKNFFKKLNLSLKEKQNGGRIYILNDEYLLKEQIKREQCHYLLIDRKTKS